MRNRLLWRACAIAFVAFALPGSAGAQRTVGELKAQVIERFAQFIEWPQPGLPPAGPFVACIIGQSETADEFARLASSRKIKDRTSEVRRVRVGANMSACHMIFIASLPAAQLPALLAGVAEKPIVTVADQPGFAEQGVLINLFQEGRYVRFEINLSAVDRTRLFFSSKLLRLARLVGT